MLRVFSYLKRHVRNIDQAVLSVHCHNDLGMAVANSLAAVRAGARQLECTINGIGEHAGNCSLEEVVMAINEDLVGAHTGIQTTRLFPTSRLVSQITGMPIPRNKAIMSPHDVGLSRTNRVLGKHSGRHAFRERVKELGFQVSDGELDRLFDEFKALAEKRGNEAARPWSLQSLSVATHDNQPARVRITLVQADGRVVVHDQSPRG
jgi:2-isopropylmalate synthase